MAYETWRALEDKINTLAEEAWELNDKLANTPYNNQHTQYKDMVKLGNIAKEILELRKAQA